MNAQEANKLAKEYNTFATNRKVHAIRQSIKDAASKGGYVVRIDSISLDVQKLLKDEGFKVEHFGDQRERESYWTVSWA